MPNQPIPTMSGKTVLLTGATSGIGKEAARALAGLGAQLVLVARDAARGEATVKEVREASGNPRVELLLADLSSLASVRALAAAFKERYPRLDVLVNNAGGVFMTRRTTPDGFEWTFAVNHLAPFLLTNLLLERLKESAPSRVVTVSSAAHHAGHVDFDDLQGERRYRGFQAYSNSKLANVLFTSELARRLQGTGVTANCLHPGVVATGFGRNEPGLVNLLVRLSRPFMLTPAKGARTLIHLASSPDVEGVSGRYFARNKPARSSRESKDPEVARRLWEVSARLVGQT